TLEGRSRHLHTINVVHAGMAGCNSLEIMPYIFRESFCGNHKNRRFVHVIPKTSHLVFRIKRPIQMPPPASYSRIRKIREHTICRPDGADHQVTIGSFTKKRSFLSFSVN